MPHLAEPRRCGGQPETSVAQLAHWPWQLGALEVFIDQRVVGDEDAMLQGQIHGCRCLAAARWGHQNHICLVQRSHALAVIVFDRILNRSHPRVVALDVPHPVQPRRHSHPWPQGSTRPVPCACRRSRSTGIWYARARRTSSSAVVEKAKGVAGPSAAASKIATTRRASSTEEINGMRRRSNRRSGNWISRALPIVSALIPVLSERKKTGTGGGSPVASIR